MPRRSSWSTTAATTSSSASCTPTPRTTARRTRRASAPSWSGATSGPWRSSTGTCTRRAAWSCTCCATSSATPGSGRPCGTTCAGKLCRNVETADLKIAIAESTGRHPDAFFDQWVLGAGYPRLSARWRFDEEARQLELQLQQMQGKRGRPPSDRSRAPKRAPGRGADCGRSSGLPPHCWWPGFRLNSRRNVPSSRRCGPDRC